MFCVHDFCYHYHTINEYYDDLVELTAGTISCAPRPTSLIARPWAKQRSPWDWKSKMICLYWYTICCFLPIFFRCFSCFTNLASYISWKMLFFFMAHMDPVIRHGPCGFRRGTSICLASANEDGCCGGSKGTRTPGATEKLQLFQRKRIYRYIFWVMFLRKEIHPKIAAKNVKKSHFKLADMEITAQTSGDAAARSALPSSGEASRNPIDSARSRSLRSKLRFLLWVAPPKHVEICSNVALPKRCCCCCCCCCCFIFRLLLLKWHYRMFRLTYFLPWTIKSFQLSEHLGFESSVFL